MVLHYLGEFYPCSRAEKNQTAGLVTIYETVVDGVSMPYLRWGSITDFSIFVLEGGEWSVLEPTTEEKLRGDVDYCLMLLGENVS